MAAFLDTLHIDRPLGLVGHSAGGALALRLALADPQRIRSLTLVDSAGLGPEVHPLLALDTLPIIGELAVMISRLPGGTGAAPSCQPPCCSPGPGGRPPSSSPNSTPSDAAPASSKPPPPQHAPCSARPANARPCSNTSPHSPPPPCSSGAAATTSCPPNQARTAVTRLPDGRLSMFPNCGHLPHVEQPDRFTAVLGDWLTEPHERQSPSAASDLAEESVLSSPQRRTA